jgi:hypothetical protein
LVRIASTSLPAGRVFDGWPYRPSGEPTALGLAPVDNQGKPARKI